MEESILSGLLQNIAILLTFSMLYDYFWAKNKNTQSIFFKLGGGIIIGGIGIVLILTPWTFVPGIFFDTRSVMLSISGIFFGTIPTLVAIIITAGFRLFQGGAGATMGIAVIVSSGTVGILWRKSRPSLNLKNSFRELLTMGILVHLVMLSCTIFLPAGIKLETLKNIAIPALVVYPFFTVLLGKLMLNQNIYEENRQALNFSEEKYRAIIEQATVAMFLADLNGNIIDTNQQACLSLGYSRTEILRLNITQIDATNNSVEKVKEMFKQMIPGEAIIFESEHLRKDGSRFPVEVNTSMVQISQSPFIIGFVRDITERKQAELKIIRIGQHYKALIEKAPDGITLIDADGNFKYVSPAAHKMFGYSTAEEIKGNPTQYTHPNDLPGVLTALQNLILNPELVITMQYRFATKSGEWKWIESTFSNLFSDPGVEAIVINFRDITDRKIADDEIIKLNNELEKKVNDRTAELESRTKELIENQAALLNMVEDLNIKSDELHQSTAQLEIANKELEAFSYSVSHDLRAPLRAISGFVSILREDYEDKLDEEGKRICSIINSNATKMGQLIDDLLSFSRLIRSELHNTSIDMEKMVKTVLSEFESTYDLSQKNILIHELPKTKGDPNLIKQVWINLIANAFKYSSRNVNATITIGSFTQNNELVYYIKDNGVGFNMDYAHKLFGVFHRLHAGNEFEGTGVGLAIVQRIITRHHGKVWAEGEVGKGAAFYFTLPFN